MDAGNSILKNSGFGRNKGEYHIYIYIFASLNRQGISIESPEKELVIAFSCLVSRQTLRVGPVQRFARPL